MADTKEEILNLAEKLIRTQGFHAFSYADISKPLAIKNAAIHYHYPSKKDLGVAVIDRNREGFNNLITEVMPALSPEKQLEKFISIYTLNHEKNMVCFMGALGPAYNMLPDEMQEGLSLAGDEIRTWVTRLLEKGKKDKVFDFQETPGEKADLIIAALMASLIMSRVSGEDVVKKVKAAIMSSTIKPVTK